MRYSVVLDPEEDGGAWNVTVPALPGCFTWGATVEEALVNAREAIAGHVAVFVETGRRVPVEETAPLLTVIEVGAGAALVGA